MQKDPYKYFRIEARELADGLAQGLVSLQRGKPARVAVPEVLRLAHTLKGAARVVRAGFVISALYNVIGVGIAAAGLLAPMVCAILRPISTATVVSWRLR